MIRRSVREYRLWSEAEWRAPVGHSPDRIGLLPSGTSPIDSAGCIGDIGG